MSITESTANSTTSAVAAENRTTSRSPLFWGAVLVAAMLIPIFFLQVFWAKLLITPWYVPIGGTLAALAALYASGWRWWRVGIAVLCVAIAGLEWTFLLAMTVLPQYTGPIAAGTAMPEFHATLADGTEIDRTYFERGRPTALIFFQGRWCPFCMTQLTELESHQADFDRAGADVVVASIEDVETAAQTQRDFPHLKVLSDERRELANAIDVINKGFSPDGGDTSAPTILLVDGQGTVRWLHRPARFIARPSAIELVERIERQAER